MIPGPDEIPGSELSPNGSPAQDLTAYNNGIGIKDY